MTGIPQGSEFAINTVTAGSQQTFFAFSGQTSHTPRAVAIDSNGDYIVTWTGRDDSSGGIYARRYNKDGVAQDTSEFQVNTTTVNNQSFSSVAMDADGDFVITWSSFQDDGSGLTSYDIYAQRYDKTGLAQGSEFLVNAPSLADQTESTVAMSADGSFVITWTGTDTNGKGVFAQRYDSAGLAQGSEFRVNTETVGAQQSSSAGMDADGDFVVTWTSTGQDGSSDGIYAQRYNKDGIAQGTEFLVNTTTAARQQNASVSMDAAGNFVVAWSSENQDGSGFGVYAQVFDAAGNRVGSEIQVNQFTASDQRSPSVSVDADGDFVITWSSNNQPTDSASTGIFSRRFNKIGIPQGSEFLVNTTVAGTQQYPAVAVDADGDFVIAWTSPDASGVGVYGQRFAPNPNNSPISLSLTSLAVIENIATPTTVGLFTTVDPDPGTSFIYTLVDETGSFPDNNSFEIGGPNNDQLILLFSPDRELKPNFTIRVRTTQTTDPDGFFYEKTLTINVIDVSDTAPTDIALTSSILAEDVAIGTVVGIVSTTDPDISDTSFTYTLVDSVNLPNNAAFSIDPNTGQLTVAAPLDFDTNPIYSIRVRTTDPSNRFYEETLNLTVTNVNEVPTALTLAATPLPEDTAPGTLVGTFSNNDPDTGDTFTYSLVDDAGFSDNAVFSIAPGTNQLILNAPLDFETKTAYSIRVQVSDGQGGTFTDTLSVDITDVDESATNTPPTTLSLAATPLPEDTAPGTLVGTFSNNDPDTGDTFTYSLVDDAGFPDNAVFSIAPGTNQLILNAPLDFETKTAYSIRVQVSDGQGGTFTDTLSVDITDVDESATNTPPTTLSLAATPLPEDTAPGTLVGTFSNNDPDTGDTFTYSLVDDAGFPDNAVFSIAPGTNQLILNAPLDFETKTAYSIRVQVSDGQGGTFTDTLSVDITDVDESATNTPPTTLSLAATPLPEDTAPGTLVGTFSNNDPDTGDTFTYSLVDDAGFPDNAVFSIAPGTNQLILNAPLDFETKTAYSIRVQVSDGQGGTFTDTLSVDITDVDESATNTPPTTLSLAATPLPEDTAPGTLVGTFSNNDPDTGDTFTYSLVDDAGFPDNAVFSIAPGTNQLILNAPLDFETKTAYSIRVQVSDGQGGTFTDTLSVDITDVDESATNTPPTTLSLAATPLPEDTAPGTLVGTFSNNDPDTGDTFTYSLVDDAGFPDNAVFSIAPGTNQLILNAPLDFETKTAYSIRVQVSDGQGGTFTDTLSVDITDVDESATNTPPTTLSLAATPLPEDTAPGTLVGTFSNNDPDTGDTFTYSLVDDAGFPDNAVFSIAPGTNQLILNAPLDFETKTAYSIRVQVSDGQGGTFTDTLSVDITDVDESATNTPPTTLSLAATPLPEDTAPGTLVGTFSNNDPDTGDTFTYSLVDDAGFPDNAVFSIAPGTNQLILNAPLDFETKTAYSIRVQVSDGQGGTFTDTLSVDITDVDESATNTPPTTLSLAATPLPEDTAPGTLVGTFSNNDPDTGDTFTYSLVDDAGFPDNAVFSIAPGTNQLILNAPLDFETKTAYSIRVQVSDGQGGTFTDTLSVDITDVDESATNTPPTTLSLAATPLPEDTAPGTLVGTFSNNDPDTGDTFTYSLVDDAGFPDNAVFSIAPGTNQLILNAPLDFETKTAYSIRVQVSDGQGGTFTDTLSVDITDVDESATNTPPTTLSLAATPLPEDTAPGTLVGTFSNNDPDTGDTFTYSLVDDAGFPDNAVFSIAPGTNQLILNAPLDFETKTAYSIRVQVSDGQGGTFTDTLSVDITDVDESATNTPPTTLSLAATPLPEDTAPGTLVGTFSNNDPDTGDTFTYSLVDDAGFPDNAVFSIAPGTNQLILNAPLDFETKTAYSIRVQVSDGQGGTFTDTLSVDITDVDESATNTPPTTLSLAATPLPEDTAPGTLVGTFSNNDPDTGDTFTYSLVDDAGFPDNAVFSIAPGTNQLILNAPLDFETKTAYSIRVQVSDGQGGTFTDTLSVDITDVDESATNTPPTTLSLAATPLPEDTAPGTLVGTFSNNDPDTGDTFTYSLVDDAGFPDNAVFSIAPGTNQLILNAPLDFETKTAYSIRVQVSDGQGGTFTDTLSVDITDVDESATNTPPTTLSLAATPLPEDTAPGTLVGTFSNNDPDTGDTFTYSLVDDAGFPDNAVFSIAPGTNQLILNAPLDFETKTAYSIRVQVSDGQGGTFTDTLSVDITDVDESATNTPPTTLSLAATPLPEDTAPGTLVGTFSNNDPDTGDTFTYSLVDDAGFPDNAVFSIAPGTNQLILNAPLDFETKTAYSIRVQVSDGQGGTFTDTLSVDITDVDESATNTPPTTLSLAATPLPEDTAPGTLVGTFSNNDPDTGDTFTYSLVDDAGFPDNAVFSIAPGTNQLILNAPLDFETKTAYSIRVQVSDGQGGTFTDTLSVDITDVDESATNTPPTTLSLAATPLPEDTAPGTLVGTFSNNDPDTGDTFTYSLVDDAGFPDNAVFSIAPGTNQLILNAPLDFETKTAYSIRVQVSDGQGGTFTDTLSVDITDVDESATNTPPTTLSLAATPLPEDTAPGTLVGTFSNNDPDTGDTFTYSLVDDAGFPDNAVFSIAPGTNQLILNAPLDFETKTAYSIRVQVSDGQGGTFTDTLSVDITDVDESATNTPPTTLSLAATPLPEDTAPGTLVGTFSNNDPDTGDTFTYSLVDDAGFPDNAVFSIAPGTNQLILNAPLDFETKTAYSIRVQVSDGQGGTFTDTLSVDITDVDESATNTPPTTLSLAATPLPEDTAPGTLVGTFSNNDPDTGDTFTYSLVDDAGFPDNAVFSIAPGTNQLILNAPLDFETKTAYSIRVQVSDGQGGTFTDTLSVDITDVDESTPGSGVPVLDLNGAAAGVNGGTAGASGNLIQLVSADATLTDTDSPNLNSALVIVSNSFDTPNETLTANTSGTGINATYSPIGVLSLTGTASIATYLQVLRSVTYLNSAVIPNTTPRNVLFIVSDGQNNAQATTTLTLDSVNSITGTAGNDTSLVTTPITDVIDAIAGNDVVTSIAAYLKQQDSINGGDGVDTLVLRDGTGNLTVRVADTTNQLPDLAVGTTISNFEAFDLSGFTGNVNMLGSAALNDNLTSGTGNDTLNGAAGADTMVGNQGDDLYVVDSAGDRVIEVPNAGTDTVQASITYKLGANLENLTLTASAANGTGNSLDNLIIGNARANQLKGGAGNDSLLGGGKSDILVGGAGDDRLNGQRGGDQLKGGQGNDSFVLSAARGFGSDVIADFKPADDTILFSRSGVESSVNLGAISAAQLVYGSTARDAGDRFVYNLQTGALLFDRDGIGSAQAVLIGTLKNKPTITASDIVVI